MGCKIQIEMKVILPIRERQHAYINKNINNLYEKMIVFSESLL